MRTFASVLGAACLLGVSVVYAHRDDPGHECVEQAKATYSTCKKDCVTDYKEAKFACRGVDPTCGIPCLGTRRECNETAKAPLETCTQSCEDTLRTEKATCRADVAQCPPDQPDAATCDACIDAAQVKGFTCRDTCREDFRKNQTAQDALRACRDTFKSCIDACPAPPAE